METSVTRSLMTRDRDFCQQGIESSSHDVINASYVARTMWKSSGVAVQLNFKVSSKKPKIYAL